MKYCQYKTIRIYPNIDDSYKISKEEHEGERVDKGIVSTPACYFIHYPEYVSDEEALEVLIKDIVKMKTESINRLSKDILDILKLKSY
jgi:hypothetical protein